jgi:Domain of unknown function (DUF4288)
MLVTGLENFKLTQASFRRLGNLQVQAYVNLRTFDLTPEVRRLQPSKRLAYMASRVDRWIRRLYRLHPKLSFELKSGKLSGRNVHRWAELPSTLVVQGSALKVSELTDAVGVSSIHITRVAQHRRNPSRRLQLVWYCVRAFVVIRVEDAKLGMQSTEDRFILVQASSFEDAKKRLKQQWRRCATPYLNSNGQMVSWSLDKVIDVYDTGQTEIDPDGDEVYSKLGCRRMRPEYVWRPKSE